MRWYGYETATFSKDLQESEWSQRVQLFAALSDVSKELTDLGSSLQKHYQLDGAEKVGLGSKSL